MSRLQTIWQSGPKGDPGPRGLPGKDGLSEYQIEALINQKLENTVYPKIHIMNKRIEALHNMFTNMEAVFKDYLEAKKGLMGDEKTNNSRRVGTTRNS